ncbi:MAG: ArsB/NhaD family transporter [Anaerolineales bacterium]|nr:ArsB/NhaD family transporter [Anaerolineales bacterium]MBX3036274.1 ArsB/NhaD family transporter [Anaerolineales bacterium]
MISTIVSSVLFLGCLALILSEKIHRTITAIAGAALMVFIGKILGFYSESGALEAIDFNTLGLLFGMMILIAMLEPTGFFQYLAVQAARASKGSPVRLFVLLGTITTVLSMFIDNVTTVVLIAPVTILISQIIGISAMPFLVAEALLSNTGGVATLIGDPPNVLIGSAANLSFNDFLIYSFPIVIFVWAGALILLRYLFRKELSKKPKSIKAIMRLNPSESLNQPKDARRILIVLGGAIFFFFIHHTLHISPAVVALSAAAIALVWVQPDVHEMFKRIEWSVLVFFAGLFVMVGGLEHAGVMDLIVSVFVQFSDIDPLLFGVGMIWVVAALSAIVDNVPITIALIPVIKGLGENGLDISPLWWALAFGAGFGGNGTIIGASANIIVATLSEKTSTPITSKIWNRRGLPVMLLTCLISSILYAIFFRWM